MTYAFRHILTSIVSSNTSQVIIGLLGEELEMHGVAHLEMRIRSSSTSTGTDRLVLTNTTSYTYNISTWSYDEATNSIQGNNLAAANAQNAMLLGTTTYGSYGDIRIFLPFINHPDYSASGSFAFPTVLSRSSHWTTAYAAGTYDRIMEFSNSSVTSAVFTGSFLDSCRFQYQSGNIVAGSQFSLYGWGL
jgi:hypothetical protein